MFPVYMRLTVTLFCVVILVVGVVGNLLVPLVVWSNKDMRNSTNLFLVNLSFADLLVLVTCVPTVLIEIHSKPEVWIIGEAMCKIVPFVEMAVTNGSALTILAISFERYYAICYPLQAGYTCTRRRAIITILFIWIVTSAVTSPIIPIVEFYLDSYIDGSTVTVCVTKASNVQRRLFFYAMMVLFFFLPLLILITIYTIITRSLMAERPAHYSSTKTLTSQDGNRTIRHDRNSVLARKQVITMLVAVVVCFFLCLAPLRAFQIWVIVVELEDLKKVGFQVYYNILYFCRIMYYINSAVNPVLYNVMSSKFRKAFRSQLACFMCSKQRRRELHHQSTVKSNSSNYLSHSLRSELKRSKRKNTAAANRVHDNYKDDIL
ncbi:Ethr (predicted) [Pycnogonum litorale]